MKNQKKSLDSLLNKLNQSYQSSSFQDLIKDPLRNKVRFENPAAALALLCHLAPEEKVEIHRIREELLNVRNRYLWWDEYAYVEDDENIGYPGLVTTSFCLWAIAESLHITPSDSVLEEIIKTIDTLYRDENDGSLTKAWINKSNVINTNLLAAQAIHRASQLLPAQSNRRRMYDECARRIVRKSLMYQSPMGWIPYHYQTHAVPFLYQAMVTAQMRYFLTEWENPVLYISWKRAVRATKSMFGKNGKIGWRKANNHDKSGTLWAYSFSLAAIGSKDHQFNEILKTLNSFKAGSLFPPTETDKREDRFFSSWIIFGLIWSSRDQKEISLGLFDWIKYSQLKKIYYLKKAKFLFLYVTNRLHNYFFPAGALENRFWKP